MAGKLHAIFPAGRCGWDKDFALVTLLCGCQGVKAKVYMQHIFGLVEKMGKKLNKIDNFEPRLTKIEGIFLNGLTWKTKWQNVHETSACELERERKDVQNG